MYKPITDCILPAVRQTFVALNLLASKAAARCEASKVSEDVYLDWRQAPDMLPLVAQFRFASEIPARALSRLAGAELPVFADDERSFEALKARTARAQVIIDSLDPAALDAEPEKLITVPMGHLKATLPRGSFAHRWIMPNLYFHTSAAYLILRGIGVELGKADYLVGIVEYVSEG
ncbi:MAG: DUF1993 domain-containing protein [Parvularculaceae bacterium]